MFWLEEGLPSSLVPGRRPRTTLSPTHRAARRRPGARDRDARRRPAGPVDAARVPPPRGLRRRPAGGDRRAVVPHRPLPVLVLPARNRAALAGAGGTLGRGRGRGAPSARPRRDRHRSVVARPGQRRRARRRRAARRARTPAACRGTPPAGSRQACSVGRAANPTQTHGDLVLCSSRCRIGTNAWRAREHFVDRLAVGGGWPTTPPLKEGNGVTCRSTAG